MKYRNLLLGTIFFAFFISTNAQLTVKDQDVLQHTLLQINDEGLGGSLTIPSIKVISDPSMKLYNLLGSLYWNGYKLGLGSSNVDQIDDLSDAKYDGSSLFLGFEAGSNDDATTNENISVGYQTLYTNTSGSANTGIGYQTLYSNIIGSYNTGIGWKSLYSNSTGYNNIGIGINALQGNTTGWSNVAVGSASLVSNVGGDDNVAIGSVALNKNISGENNTSCGTYSLYLNETGNTNTAHGAYALYQNKTGSYNTAVGYSSDVTSDNLSNTTALGYDAHVGASDQVRVGNSNVNSIGGNVAWSYPSDGRYKINVREDVSGLDFVMGLRPVTYNLDVEALAEKLHEGYAVDEKGNKTKLVIGSETIASRQKKASQLNSGFIAQEVEELSKRIGYDFSGVEVPENSENMYRLRYSEFVVPLVKAVQEQQEIIESLKNRIAELEKRKN